MTELPFCVWFAKFNPFIPVFVFSESLSGTPHPLTGKDQRALSRTKISSPVIPLEAEGGCGHRSSAQAMSPYISELLPGDIRQRLLKIPRDVTYPHFSNPFKYNLGWRTMKIHPAENNLFKIILPDPKSRYITPKWGWALSLPGLKRSS